MRIVIGRGNSRQSVVVPTGELVRNAKPEEANAFVRNMCGLLGVPLLN